MEERAPKLTMILEYVGPGKGPEAYQLWACRGATKGCKKKQKKMKHCADCFLPDEKRLLAKSRSESIEVMHERIPRFPRY